MIPEYPNFKPATIEIERAFDSLTKAFPPYAEFSFPCLFAWDTENTAAVATHNNNLVIQMPDYESMEPFYSVLGTTDVDTAIDELLDKYNHLEMVPEVTVNAIKDKQKYKIKEDRDQHDYVYSLDDQVNLPGKHFKGRRIKSGRTLRLYNDHLVLQTINFGNEQDKKDTIQIAEKWAHEKGMSDQEFAHEKKAINKILEYARYFNLVGLMVRIDDVGVGFSINQVLNEDYSVCRFQKCLPSVPHLDVFLTKMTATELKHYGCKYISWEQDLGVEGLREFKMSYKPIKFLKKYSIKAV